MIPPDQEIYEVEQRIAMRRIARRHARHRSGQVMENFREQRIVEMQVNGLAHVRITGAVEAEGNPGVVEVGVEARRPLERADIELVRIFQRHFGFIGDGLGHALGLISFV